MGRPWGFHWSHGQIGVGLVLELVIVEACLWSVQGRSERGRAGQLCFHIRVHPYKHICGNVVLHSSTDTCDKIIIQILSDGMG